MEARTPSSSAASVRVKWFRPEVGPQLFTRLERSSSRLSAGMEIDTSGTGRLQNYTFLKVFWSFFCDNPFIYGDLPLLKLGFSVIFGDYPLLYRWCLSFLSLWPSAINIDFLHIMYQPNSIIRICTYLNFTFPFFEYMPQVQNRVPTFKAASHP